jgi:hypothetical protein
MKVNKRFFRRVICHRYDELGRVDDESCKCWDCLIEGGEE